jgi:hypothetical protein
MRRTEVLQGLRRMKFEDVDGRWQQRRLSQAEAAEILGMSERRFRRWRDRYEGEGVAGLLDRRLGKASTKRVPADQVHTPLTLYRERYDAGAPAQGARARRHHHGRGRQPVPARGLPAGAQRPLGGPARAPRDGLRRRRRRRPSGHLVRAGGARGRQRQHRALPRPELADPAEPDPATLRQGAGARPRLPGRHARHLPCAALRGDHRDRPWEPATRCLARYRADGSPLDHDALLAA